MKKLLNILNTITLIGTASKSIIGCGGNSPIPYIENDISNKITNPIKLGKLDANTKVDFLTKLQIKLILMANLATITTNDYHVYKAGTTDEIQDSDITKGTFLKIKIVAKGNKFTGNQDNITVNYILKDEKINLNIDDLKWTLKFTKKMTGESAYYIIRSEIKNLSLGIYKSADEVRSDESILISIWTNKGKQLVDDTMVKLANIDNIDIKIKVTAKNKAFAKLDWITISNLIIIEDRNDLSIFPAEINIKCKNTDQIVEGFKRKLIYKLNETKLIITSLKLEDIEITKIDGSQIESNNINSGILDIKITAKPNSQYFKGEKNIKINIMIFYEFENLNAGSLVMSSNKSDWYVSTTDPNYNSKIYKNGKEIDHLDSQVLSLIVVDNDWYAGTQTALVEGKIYKNGKEIANFDSPVLSLAVNGNDWYASLYGEHLEIYKNGKEITKLDSHADYLVVNGNDWYAANVDGKIYKNGKEIVNLKTNISALVVNGNDWYAANVDGKIYKNGKEIVNLKTNISALVVNGNDWYAACGYQIYKNGKEIANLWSPFDLFVSKIGALVINDNYLFAANTNGNNKVYKIKIS